MSGSSHAIALAPAVDWIEFLRSRIRMDWRPGEFDPEELLYVPDPEAPMTLLFICHKAGCGIRLDSAGLCPTCRKQALREAEVTGEGFELEAWLEEPRVERAKDVAPCRLEGCERPTRTRGLCASHYGAYADFVRRHDSHESVEDWLARKTARPLAARPICPIYACGREQRLTGICDEHRRVYTAWCARYRRNAAISQWVEIHNAERSSPRSVYQLGRLAATPFGDLPEPVRWELLYAVQQRDLTGKARMTPIDLRRFWLQLDRDRPGSLVGLDKLGMTPPASDNSLGGHLRDLQLRIDSAHREWSGVDLRPKDVFYFAELDMRYSPKSHGPRAGIDMTSVRTQWLLETARNYVLEAGPHGVPALRNLQSVVALADDVFVSRHVQPEHLGRKEVAAIVRMVRKKWTAPRDQGDRLRAIQNLIDFGRHDPSGPRVWRQIPTEFQVDPREFRRGQSRQSTRSGDEPFRFVPQPIVDWVMDHIHLIERRTPYLTAEARLMIYLQERCGRRTMETTRLRDDCISYDSAGNPYLEWTRGKKPWGAGKSLPIHPQTHDAIREWQEIKREAGVESEWLFPSMRARNDIPVHDSYLGARLDELVSAIVEEAPYESAVEGAEGNLIHFDLTSLDPYSFRHAFAQRHADATDADGRQTVRQDALQELMDHKYANTTATYYVVTMKRRQHVIHAVPPRRLNLRGEVVEIDRQRDTFVKLAVSLGTCTEPLNVATGGDACLMNHACESCPFFLVDPFERDGLVAKRLHLLAQIERLNIIAPDSHMVEHYRSRVGDCDRIIAGIDRYVAGLPLGEREQIERALEQFADVRRRATAPRRIDLRALASAPAS